MRLEGAARINRTDLAKVAYPAKRNPCVLVGRVEDMQ